MTGLLMNKRDPTDVKIPSKLSDLKSLHARWIVDWYNHVKNEKEIVINGFDCAGNSEAIQNV